MATSGEALDYGCDLAGQQGRHVSTTGGEATPRSSVARVNTTGGETPEDYQKAMKALEALATWSAWVPLAVVRVEAPRLPGVYMAREGATGRIIYVGMAGERDGRGRVSPKGIWAASRSTPAAKAQSVDWARRHSTVRSPTPTGSRIS